MTVNPDKQRRISGAYLEAGAQIVKSNLEKTSTALPMLLGGLSLRGVSRAAEKSTAAFYKYWSTFEEYTEDLATKMSNESLGSTARQAALYNNLIHWPERPEIDTVTRGELLNQYIQNCAAEIASDDPYLSVRWHIRPHITSDQIEQTESFEISKGALSFIKGWGIEIIPTDGQFSFNGVKLLDMIDYHAFIEVSPEGA